MAWAGTRMFGERWEEEKQPSSHDFVLIFVCAFFFFPVVRFILDRVFLQRLGQKFVLGHMKPLSPAETEARQKKVTKFKECGWKCIFHLSELVLALAVTYNEPWFTDTKKFWVGPGDQVWPDLRIKKKLRWLYMYTGGFYTYSIFDLMFWEIRRSDYVVTMTHHVVTVALIVFSYIAKFARIGSMVLSLHAASDVFLLIGKMTKYCGLELIPSLTLICFAVSWLLLRLIYYPFWIIWSTSYEVLQILDISKYEKEGPISYYIFNSLLISLLVMHIYWWVLVIRMVIRLIQAGGQVGDDVRSDEEDEDGED